MQQRRGGYSNAYSNLGGGPGCGGDGDDAIELDGYPHIGESGSSAYLSQGMRIHVRNLYQGQCWLCFQAIGGEVAHVFPRAGEEMFREHRENGVIGVSSINSVENLLLLCPDCHLAFDSNFPGRVMLPIDLLDMIAGEEAFQAHRQREHEAGRPCARIANSIETKFYQRFLVRSEFYRWNPGLFSDIPVRDWKGDPACVLRSTGFLTIAHSNPLLLAVTPQYLRLLELYQRPVPPVVAGLEQPNDQGGSPPSESEDELHRDDKEMTFRPPKSSHSRPNTGRPILFGPHWTSEGLAELWRLYKAPVKRVQRLD
ncbi:MAG: hypothetical protein M1840_000209 [Geoglossum simile]|nr:MAG: hypothetical protein M1840_000209 [Geoglossum simile]